LGELVTHCDVWFPDRLRWVVVLHVQILRMTMMNNSENARISTI
jgi:hypothetical protein